MIACENLHVCTAWTWCCELTLKVLCRSLYAPHTKKNKKTKLCGSFYAPHTNFHSFNDLFEVTTTANAVSHVTARKVTYICYLISCTEEGYKSHPVWAWNAGFYSFVAMLQDYQFHLVIFRHDPQWSFKKKKILQSFSNASDYQFHLAIFWHHPKLFFPPFFFLFFFFFFLSFLKLFNHTHLYNAYNLTVQLAAMSMQGSDRKRNKK